MQPKLARSLFIAGSYLVTSLPGRAQNDPLFVDVGPAAGADQVGFGRGAAFVDLDLDGRLDIVAADSAQRMTFLRQEADATFTSAYDLWGAPASAADAWGVVAADFDEDGDPDLYVPRGGWSGPRPNLLLANELNTLGVLTDHSSSGDAAIAAASFGATALDYDRDGDVDVFVSNRQAFGGGAATCTLLRNDGNLVLTDVSSTAGIVQAGAYTHCTAGDLDNDGWPDVAVGGINNANLLYHNRGDGTFEEIAQAAGVDTPGQNYGLVFEDFDNDGWMDLWSPKYHGTGELFLNAGDGTFVQAQVAMPSVTDMGHNTGDANGDGYPDLYIGTGGPGYPIDDRLLLVQPTAAGGLLLTDVSFSSGILASGPTRSHGCPFGDYDKDGDLDFFANNGGPEWLPLTAQESFLWQSQGTGNAWLAVELEGVLSNRSAIGARGQVRLPTGRDVHRHRTAGKGFANSDAPELFFGLGAASSAVSLEVRWPSGVRQILAAPPIDTRSTLVETGLVLTGTAALGAELTLDFCGPAGSSVLLSAKLTLANGQPFPLAPTLIPNLDAQGLAQASLALPAQPQLNGATLVISAQIAPPGGGAVTSTPALVYVL